MMVFSRGAVFVRSRLKVFTVIFAVKSASVGGFLLVCKASRRKQKQNKKTNEQTYTNANCIFSNKNENKKYSQCASCDFTVCA